MTTRSFINSSTVEPVSVVGEKTLGSSFWDLKFKVSGAESSAIAVPHAKGFWTILSPDGRTLAHRERSLRRALWTSIAALRRERFIQWHADARARDGDAYDADATSDAYYARFLKES